MATRGGAECLGRVGELGELSVGAVGDVVVWSLTGLKFAGGWSDPIEAWLRCGPTSARTVVIAGKVVVDGGSLLDDRVEERLRDHRRLALAMQA